VFLTARLRVVASVKRFQFKTVSSHACPPLSRRGLGLLGHMPPGASPRPPLLVRRPVLLPPHPRRRGQPAAVLCPAQRRPARGECGLVASGGQNAATAGSSEPVPCGNGSGRSSRSSTRPTISSPGSTSRAGGPRTASKAGARLVRRAHQGLLGRRRRDARQRACLSGHGLWMAAKYVWILPETRTVLVSIGQSWTRSAACQPLRNVWNHDEAMAARQIWRAAGAAVTPSQPQPPLPLLASLAGAYSMPPPADRRRRGGGRGLGGDAAKAPFGPMGECAAGGVADGARWGVRLCFASRRLGRGGG
jgi:hypothetical protein